MAASRAVLDTLSRCTRALGKRRPLYASESRFLSREFGQSLDLRAITLAGGGHPLGRGAWQPAGALIQMHDTYFEQDDPQAELRPAAYPVFAHEALHVWQRRHRHCRVHVSVDGLWLGLTQGQRAYTYDRSRSDPRELLRYFLTCNIEQQGQLFQDYVHSAITDPAGRPAKFACIARYVKSPGLEQLATLLRE